jgi:hypothetical protein
MKRREFAPCGSDEVFDPDRWLEAVLRAYPEPDPGRDRWDAHVRWFARATCWGHRVDPYGANRWMESIVLERAVDEGWCEHAGISDDGQLIYRSLIFKASPGEDPPR